MTKVKICGTTNLDDARQAVAAGADYLGFIFYPPSKRTTDVATTKAIVAELRQSPLSAQLVGVFVNEPADKVAAILDTCALDLAQLHGDEAPWMVGDRRSPLYGRVFKALRPTSQVEAEAEAEWYVPPERQPDQPQLLIDTYHPNLRGGTGQLADWDVSARLAQTYPGLMLAGGLTPENVAAAVRQVRPFAVDVASGVEAAPGIKAPVKVAAFIKRAKAGV